MQLHITRGFSFQPSWTIFIGIHKSSQCIHPSIKPPCRLMTGGYSDCSIQPLSVHTVSFILYQSWSPWSLIRAPISSGLRESVTLLKLTRLDDFFFLIGRYRTLAAPEGLVCPLISGKNCLSCLPRRI